MSRLTKLTFQFIISPFFIGIVVTIVITWIAQDYYRETSIVGEHRLHPLNAYISDIHQRTIGWRMKNRGPIAGDPRVAILAIDDRSVELEGRWPWPREKMAGLVERTIEDGAKSLAFDIVFSEEDNSSAGPALTRLKRTLAQQNGLTPNVDAQITRELSEQNGDDRFAAVIKKDNEHLVLGAFSDPHENFNERSTPLSDTCLASLFARSYQSFYWRKEAITVGVTDFSINPQKELPEIFKKAISDYVTQMEVQESMQWFTENRVKSDQLTQAFQEIGNPLPPEAYPGLAVIWINESYEMAIDLLQPLKPELANREGVASLFARFNSSFTKKEKAELGLRIRRVDAHHCANFMTNDDDLWSLPNYQKIWGTDPTTVENFQAIGWPTVWSEFQKQNPSFKNFTLTQARDGWMKNELTNSIASVGRWWTNIPLLGNQTLHSGTFDTTLDTDGTIRRAPLVKRLGDTYVPSLALKTLMLDQNLHLSLELAASPLTNSGTNETKYLKSVKLLDEKNKLVMEIPADPQGNTMINYSGPEAMFAYVSAADVLNDSTSIMVNQQHFDSTSRRWYSKSESVKKTDFLKDKLLFLGATAKGVFDLRVIPFDENYPGVETHANLLSNLLTELAKTKGQTKPYPGFLRTSPEEAKTMLFTMLALGLLLAFLISHLGSLAGLGTALIFGGMVYAVDNFYFFPEGLVITSIFPMSVVMGNFVALTFYKYFTEERTKRELKGTFEKYVSPSIVAEILADPSNIELGGKKLELTVLFSDVRGFTTISEKLDPRALSDLLNGYLTPMTELVFENKGTLDKYMGDAIMAFWGAPIHFQDHAAHACRCALQMITKLKLLQAEYRAKGYPEIDIGIGLNTGDMSVGNMGSNTVRSYTVMGDAVNLGSRLEGINKQYGTRIIISEFTQRAIGPEFVTREIDWVVVKGKLQPVRIFELVHEGPPSAEMQRLLEAFGRGFMLYHELHFQEALNAFNEALNAQPNDAPSLLYIERCQKYLQEPPPAGWDGVYTMTSK